MHTGTVLVGMGVFLVWGETDYTGLVVVGMGDGLVMDWVGFVSHKGRNSCWW